MKEVKAVIQPFMLDRVLNALHGIPGLPGAAVSETRAVSVEHGHYEQIVKTKLEIVVPDDKADVVVEAIQAAAHTGNPGDGRVFVIPVEQTVSIKSGEWGRGSAPTPVPAGDAL